MRKKGGRSAAYRAKCPSHLQPVLEAARAARYCIVQEEGPLSFIVRGTGTGRVATRRVQIGDPHRCSCGAEDVCVHAMWVMLRVYKLPESSPLLWQRGLVEAEITATLRGAVRVREGRRDEAVRRRRMTEARVKKARGGPIQRRPLDDQCAICCETMEGADTDWCRGGCGNNVHRACLAAWAAHRAPLPPSCPYCRAVWVFPTESAEAVPLCQPCLGPVAGAGATAGGRTPAQRFPSLCSKPSENVRR